jgi:hypothetical protein
MDEKKFKENWSVLLNGIRRSVRYHTHRRKFFDNLSVWSDFLIIISGGTVVGFASSGEGKHQMWTIIFGALTAIIGSFDLVIGFSSKARDYHDLAREFSELERQMIAVRETRTEKDLIIFTNRRLEIEEDEPPILQVLNCYCHNELVKSMDLPEKEKVKITFWQSVFKQWVDVFPSNLEKIGDKSESPIIMPPKAGALQS